MTLTSGNGPIDSPTNIWFPSFKFGESPNDGPWPIIQKVDIGMGYLTHRFTFGAKRMMIPKMYWSHVVSAVAQIAKHGERGLCIRPKPYTYPLKFCVRPAVEGSKCCTNHQNDCPIKK